MSVILSPFAGAGAQFFDNSGNLLSGGLIYTYTAGTTTPQATYTTSSGSVAQANPIVLDSSGRVPNGEIWLTAGVIYKFVLQNSVGSTIATYDNIDGVNDFSSFTASSGSSLIGYLPPGTGSVATTVQAKLQQTVSVIDFGADPTGSTDSTTAFTNAQTASKNVYIPPGTYLLNGLRIQNGVNLIGAGKTAVSINQSVAGTPAINCTSDASVGQLKNVNLSGFTVFGATSATVAAVLVAAYGAYAIWNSTFDYSAKNTFRALEIQGATSNNVFDCKFTIQSEGTSDTAVLANGGVYNLFDLFLTQCASYALSDSGFNCTYIRLVTDNCWTSSGQNTVFINPTVEQIYSSSAPSSTVITLSGFNQTLINLTVILNTANSAKVTTVLTPFSGTNLTEPRFLCTVTNPFGTSNQTWTLIGPGQSSCTNKIETVYDGSADIKNLRNVTFVSNCSTFTNQSVPHGGKNVQYLAPSGSFNFTALSNTDAVIFDFTGTIAVANVVIGTTGVSILNNQVISFYSKGTITTLNITSQSSANVALLPTTMAAGSKFSAIYYSTTNTWYPIG